MALQHASILPSPIFRGWKLDWVRAALPSACIALRLRLALERAEEIYLETSMCAERRGDTNLIELRRDAPDVWEQ